MRFALRDLSPNSKRAWDALTRRLIIVVLAAEAITGCTLAPTAPASQPVPAATQPQKPEEPKQSPTTSQSNSNVNLTSYNVSDTTKGTVAARICATVNGVAILDNELREAGYPYFLATMSLPEPERSRARHEIMVKELEQLVDREVILQQLFDRLKDQKVALSKLKEAATKDFEDRMRRMRTGTTIKNDDEFKAFLRTQGISLEGVRRQTERNFMAAEFMRHQLHDKIEAIGHEQIEDYYKRHPEEFQVSDSVVWQDIFLDVTRFPNIDAARQLAEALSQKARNGEDFAQMVRQYDQGDSSYRKGEGCGRRRGEIRPPQAEELLFRMNPGEIGPIIAMGSGFHVIKLVSREYAGTRPFNDKTQGEIRNKLQSETWEREYKNLIAQMKRKTAVEISPTSLP